MKKFKLGALAIGLAVMMPMGAAMAQETAHGGYEELGKDKDWTAIRFKAPGGDGAMSCAIFSRPKASRVVEGNSEVDALRGEKAAFISWDDGVEVSSKTGVLSFLMGAPVVPKAAGHVMSVDAEKNFPLFGAEDRVYTDEDDDAAVIKAIRGGRSVNVRVKISETREASDEYSLYGVQAATNMAARACN